MADPQRTGSMTLVDAAFDAQDPSFVERLRSVVQPKALAAFVERWKRDPRPWARERQADYLLLPANCPGHEVVVKRLFKHAEATGDAEILGVCAVAFDRIVRRKTEMRFAWTGESYERTETATTPRDSLPRVGHPKTSALTGMTSVLEVRDGVLRTVVRTRSGRSWMLDLSDAAERRLFTAHTRAHLRRRVWRRLRRLAKEAPDTYLRAATTALRSYTDDDVSSGLRLLDRRNLLRILFSRSAAIDLTRTNAAVADGRTIADLAAAPAFPEVWGTDAAFAVLRDLALAAPCRTVRVAALDMLRTAHRERIEAAGVLALRPFLDSPHDETQTFGVEMLENVRGVERLTVDEWTVLLGVRSPVALATVCRQFRRWVDPERVPVRRIVDLACARPAPVAETGLALLRDRAAAALADLASTARLADARCEAVGAEVAVIGLCAVGSDTAYDVDRVIAFFDSPVGSVRTGAWAWLRESRRAWNDAVLWSRLCESPWDDVRHALVSALDARTKPARSGRAELAPVWCAVLLGVERGGRERQRALRQIAGTLAARPDQATALVPVLRAAVRSIRAPDRRAGLAAVASVIERRPELAAAIAEALPEVQFGSAVG